MSEVRPIQRSEVNDAVKRVARYKILKVTGDKKYTSVVAGTGSYIDVDPLDYENGRVTEAPAFPVDGKIADVAGGDLIYAYKTLDLAKDDLTKIGAEKEGKRVIVEVLPIGKFRDNKKKDGVIMCEAVLVGREVAEHTFPSEIDVTDDCIFNTDSGDGIHIYNEEWDELGFLPVGSTTFEDVADGYKLFVVDGKIQVIQMA